MYTLEDIYKPFENFNHRLVSALLEPSPGITVNPSFMGGHPNRQRHKLRQRTDTRDIDTGLVSRPFFFHQHGIDEYQSFQSFN